MQYNETSESKFCYNSIFVPLLILIIGHTKLNALKEYVQKVPEGKFLHPGDGGYRVFRHICFTFKNIRSIQKGKILTFMVVKLKTIHS